MTAETDRIEADINRSRHALNDTIEQLGGKLSPGQMLDEALGLAQGQAGQFTGNLGRQVRDNPLPVLLIGAGIGMLFMNRHNHGGSGRRGQSATRSGMRTALPQAGRRAPASRKWSAKRRRRSTTACTKPKPTALGPQAASRRGDRRLQGAREIRRLKASLTPRRAFASA